MADQPNLASLEDLEKEVTCCVCLDQYTDPKLLPCQHVFCSDCILQMTNRSNNYVKCPNCRKHFELPPGGANSFPAAFHMNTMIDLLKKMSNQPVFQICSKHNDHLTVYCETCSKVICRDCTISEEHNKHTYSLISECYPKHHQQILDKVGQVKHKVANTDAAKAHLASREREVQQQGESIKEQINQHAQKLIDDIQRSRIRLTQEVDTVVQQILQKIQPQKQLAEELITQLKTSVEKMEHNLKDWTKERILSQKHVIMDEMDTATREAEALAEDSFKDIGLRFEKNDLPESGIGKMAHSQLAIEKTSVEVMPCLAGQPSTATLSLLSEDGSPYTLTPSLIIASRLSSPAKQQPMKCSIARTREPGKYKIKFTPFTRKDVLYVRIAGVNLTPKTIPVIPTPEARGVPIKVIQGLNRPQGVAVFKNGDIVVAENGAHCLTLFDKTGEKKGTIGAKGNEDGYFMHPNRVAISIDDHILVTDDHRLQKFNANGTFINAIYGGETNGGQFKYPEGIAVQPRTGQIFVADSLNNRIQVFTDDLFPVRTINPSGFLLLLQRLKNPHDIAVDNNGFLYIADKEKNCIRQLNDEGKMIRKFGSRGSSPDGHLSAPSSLVVHNDFMYVSEWGNHRVSVFKTSGEFVCCFSGYGKESGEGGKLCEPHGIAMDASGDLYVCDTKNNRIVVF